MKPSFVQRLLYIFSKTICRVYFKIGWRLEAYGTENIPQKGAAVLAANHRSYADPPLVGVSISRDAHFLAKEELFRFRPFGWLISALNAHPLKRSGGDIGAFKISKKILEQGDLLIVFPEGRRNRSEHLGKSKAGAGLLAKMVDCPIIPVYIHNSAEMLSFKKISVYFGKPILPQKSDSHQNLADEVMLKISELKALVT